MNLPRGVTGDGSSYLYVVDAGTNRILRFSTAGAFLGWIGGINGTATTGPATSNDSASCTGAVNQFTPGWCIGGQSTSGTGNGYLNYPTAITYSGGKLYVVDYNNSRVSSYNASTGAFIGWIGRVNSTTGISPAVTVLSGNNYTSGWTTGGTSMAAAEGGDPGGGFYFSTCGFGGVATDGTYLYVSNPGNSRVDRFNLSSGVYQGSARTNWSQYTNVWTNPATSKAWGTNTTVPSWGYEGFATYGLYVTGTTLYAAGGCGQGQVSKMNLSTGSVIGYQSALSSAPSGGDTGCVGATGTTPGWCQGGSTTTGYRLGNSNNVGGFTSPNYVTGDANFIYVSDDNTHRVTRISK
jgi:hypothetical protein